MAINKKTKTEKYIAENTNSQPLPLTGDLYKQNKRRISSAKMFRFVFLSATSLVIIFSLFSGAITLYSNTSKAETVSQDSIVKSLSKHIILPEAKTLIEVRRISDIDQLKNQNNFYKNAATGDYIVVYPQMSMVYDYYHDIIKSIVTKNEE